MGGINMKKIRVGIIGTGGISRQHLQAYQKLEHVEIIAACDINEEKVNAYAKRHNIEHVFTDYHEMLKLNELDAVSVTTWNNQHAPISIAAMRAGKDVLCEKPLAMNEEEAAKMLKVSKETNRLLMVGFVMRFDPKSTYVKEQIEKGELGSIYYAKAGYLRKWGNPGGWFCDKKRSAGGPVIDLGVHIIDLIRYVVGNPNPVSVTASTFKHLGLKPEMKGITKYCSSDYDSKNPYCDVEDGAVALIKFDNGLTLCLDTSWVLNIKEDHNYIDLCGDKAGLSILPQLEIYGEENQYYVNKQPLVNKASGEFDNIFNKEIAHFIECVQTGSPCINTAADGVMIMKIIDAIYKSADTGKEIMLNQ